MNDSEKIHAIIKDMQVAIINLKKIVQDYLEMMGHTKNLIEALFNLESKLLNDFFEVARDDAEIEDNDKNEEGMIFHSPGKKDLLH